MHVIWLNRYLKGLPLMLFTDFMDERFQANRQRTYQNLPTPFRTPNDMIHHQMDAVLFMLVFHVSSIAYINIACKWERGRVLRRAVSSPA